MCVCVCVCTLKRGKDPSYTLLTIFPFDYKKPQITRSSFEMWVCTRLKETNNKRNAQLHFNNQPFPNRKHTLLVAPKWLSLSVPDTLIVATTTTTTKYAEEIKSYGNQ